MRNILLIDDEESVRELIPNIFPKEEYNIAAVKDGVTGIDMLKSNNFQVALVDIKMPGKNGIEVLKQLKADNPEIEVLIITGHGSMEETIQAMKHDASDFILKPFDNEELFLSVKKAFESYELRAENRRLIRELREEKDRLLKVNEKLRELDQMKSKFVSTVSHELRTPLTVIISTVNNILDGTVGDVPEYHLKWLNMIKSNGQRLNSLIEDILDVSRLESAKEDKNRIRLDIVDLIRKVVSNLSSLAQKNKIKISVNAFESLPMVEAHVGRIEQVVTNLITNSIKFTPPDGLITINIKRKANFISIEVEDTGIGIAKENLKSIFDRFYQVQNNQDGRLKGIGLGLAIAKEIIAQHNGRIWAESQTGKGSKFTFTLPISLFNSSEKVHIMAIEDEEEIRELYKLILEKLGFEVEVVSTGEEGIEMVKKGDKSYDIVFSDLNLPVKNGVEVLHKIKSIDPGIQTAIITAYPDSKLLSEALKYGPLMIVSKPIDERKIYEVVQKLIAQKNIIYKKIENEN
ncbi:MAG: response regulator [bacterium]